MNMIVTCRHHTIAHPKLQPIKRKCFCGVLAEKVPSSCCIPMTMRLAPLKLNDGMVYKSTSSVSKYNLSYSPLKIGY